MATPRNPESREVSLEQAVQANREDSRATPYVQSHLHKESSLDGNRVTWNPPAINRCRAYRRCDRDTTLHSQRGSRCAWLYHLTSIRRMFVIKGEHFLTYHDSGKESLGGKVVEQRAKSKAGRAGCRPWSSGRLFRAYRTTAMVVNGQRRGKKKRGNAFFCWGLLVESWGPRKRLMSHAVDVGELNR